MSTPSNLSSSSAELIADITPCLRRLGTAIEAFSNSSEPLAAPDFIQRSINDVLTFLLNAPHPQGSRARLDTRFSGASRPISFSNLINTRSISNSSSSSDSGNTFNSEHQPPEEYLPVNNFGGSTVVTLGENIKINRKTSLAKAFKYPVAGTIVEYPETVKNGSIGHMFRMPDDVNSWVNPALSSAYAQGRPESRFSKKNIVSVSVLKDEDGNDVDCQVSHTTCQGLKICPFYNREKAAKEHTSASREALRTRLADDRSLRRTFNDSHSSWDLYGKLLERTLSFFEALRSRGCGFPIHELTHREGFEHEEHSRLQEALEKGRRGHPAKATCSGRIVLEERLANNHIYLRCEHYNKHRNRDHYVSSLADSLYDIRYLKALFTHNKELIDEIEEDLFIFHNAGPSSTCSFTTNVSSVRVHCPFPHRDLEGRLVRAELIRQTCECTFRYFQPTLENRKKCPWSLLTCHGPHTHPIPVLSKTPRVISSSILDLLRSMKDEIPDMTPRRFIRNPSVHSFLRNRLPSIQDPLLSDLHPSLANRDHLKNYITQVKAEFFPNGTGWKGLQFLKEEQDRNGSLPYIRYMTELADDAGSDSGDSADEARDLNSKPLQICVCMTPEGSKRLASARYIQSDISFKRVAGFMEFEIGGMIEESNTSFVFCRVYLTRQDARTHALVFRKISDIVKSDTGQELKWRHLHASKMDELIGICLVNVDQHGGQAKGAWTF
ncbi:hypothetical protein MD484_g8674, partial [Candolleomyces efflorescens]